MKQSWIIKLMCAVTVSSCTLTLVAGRAPYCDQNWSYRRTLSACGPPEICRNCNRQRQLSPYRNSILNDECIAKHGRNDELKRWCMVLPSGYTGDIEVCKTPAISNSMPYNCTNSNKYLKKYFSTGKMVPGTVCVFNCDHGYILNGSKTVECVDEPNKILQWNDSLPSCEPIAVCKTPAVSNSMSYNCTNENKYLKKYFSTGKMVPETVCIFSCDHGYVLNGSKTVECVDEPKKMLQWNDSLPSCEPIAEILTDPIESSTVTKDDVGDVTDIGATEGVSFKVVVAILSAVAAVCLTFVIILLCKKHYSKWCRDTTASMQDFIKTQKASDKNDADENFLVISHTESSVSVENHAAQPELIGIPDESKTPRHSLVADGQEELCVPELQPHLQQLNLGEHTSQQVFPQPPLSQKNCLKPHHPGLTAAVTPISREPVENDDRNISACPEQLDTCNHIIWEQKQECNSLLISYVDNSAHNPGISNTLNTDLDLTSRKEIRSNDNNVYDNEKISEGKFGQLTEDGEKVTKVVKQEEQNETEPHEIQSLLNSFADIHRSEASGASQSDINELDDANSICKEELSSRETVL